MNCPIFKVCESFASDHLSYLRTLKTPEAIVWGNANGSRNKHAWCSDTRKMNQTVDKLRAFYPTFLSLSFKNFEDLYDWVFDNIIEGIWVDARVLHYDIALRIAANHQDAYKILPSACVYLHGKLWRTAKEIDATLNRKDFWKPSNYLDRIFDCGHCNAWIKEHALCEYHNELIEIARSLTR